MALTRIKEEPRKIMYWSTLPNNPLRMRDLGFDLGFRLEYDDVQKVFTFVSPTDPKGDDDTE